MTLFAQLTRSDLIAPMKAPLLAGAASAVLFALGLGVIAVFGSGEFQIPRISGPVTAALDENEGEAVLAEAESLRADSGEQEAIDFVSPDQGEVSLPGVSEGFTVAPQEEEAVATAVAAYAAGSNPDALPAAPIIGLGEPGPGGLLPVIAADGTRPSQAYARPFDRNRTEPAIAIVIGGLGLNQAVTQAAIDDLPPEVTLSFAPYAQDLQTWIDRARAAGHEVMIEAPMEPYDYPNNDPGPHTLLADGPSSENHRRLLWVLSRAQGYFAVTNYLGARFSASEDAMTYVLDTLENRGVAFLHDGAGRRSTIENAARAAGVKFAIADRVIDEEPSPRSIDDRLLTLEALALQQGSALGAGFAYPATVDQVTNWASGLELRGYQLAPASAVMAMRREAEAPASAGESYEAGNGAD